MVLISRLLPKRRGQEVVAALRDELVHQLRLVNVVVAVLYEALEVLYAYGVLFHDSCVCLLQR